MCSTCYTAKERRLQQHTSAQLHAGETVTLQKLVWIDWRDDRQAVLDEWGSASLRQLEMCAQQSYDQLLAVSTENWRQWWQKRRITVNGGEAHDQQALDYALYHLRIMTPAPRRAQQHCGKRLNRRRLQRPRFLGYRSIFCYRFICLAIRSVARSLLRYRWHNLPGRAGESATQRLAGRAISVGKRAQRRRRDAGICRH